MAKNGVPLVKENIFEIRKEITMQFLIKAYDGTDSDALNRRMSVRPDHLENITKVKEKGKVVCAGGILNEAGSPIGSFLVMDFETREMLDDYLKTEPYVLNNVWQDIKVEICNTVIINDEFYS